MPMNTKNKNSRPTIVDVAKMAGVSTMTVSRVIRKHNKVSESTREKVEAAIAQLGYSPNLVARALVGAKVKRVCLLFGNPSSAYLGELMFGALKASSSFDANLIVERVGHDIDIDRLANQFDEQWDAVVIPPPMSDIPAIRGLIEKTQFPAVFLSSAFESHSANYRFNDIRIDDYQSAYDITQLLIAKGHHRIAFIQGDKAQTVSARRLSGYQQAMLDAGLAALEDYVVAGDFSYQSGEQAALQLLSLAQPPTAIFASNDDMAAGVIAAAKHKNLSIPKQLAITGFDDSAIATIVSPALTTVRQPVAEMAEQAVQLLLQDSTDTPSLGVVWVQHAIIERETT